MTEKTLYDLGCLRLEIDFRNFKEGDRIRVHGVEEVVIQYEPPLGFITAKDEGNLIDASRVPVASLTLTSYDIYRDGRKSFFIVPREIRTVLQSGNSEEIVGSALSDITYDQAKKLKERF